MRAAIAFCGAPVISRHHRHVEAEAAQALDEPARLGLQRIRDAEKSDRHVVRPDGERREPAVREAIGLRLHLVRESFGAPDTHLRALDGRGCARPGHDGVFRAFRDGDA